MSEKKEPHAPGVGAESRAINAEFDATGVKFHDRAAKGGSKRQKALVTLTNEEFQLLLGELKEPFRTMATVAMCTGLRISEVLALRWESLNFDASAMLVERAVVTGRIGPTKTETSKDDVPARR